MKVRQARRVLKWIVKNLSRNQLKDKLDFVSGEEKEKIEKLIATFKKIQKLGYDTKTIKRWVWVLSDKFLGAYGKALKNEEKEELQKEQASLNDFVLALCESIKNILERIPRGFGAKFFINRGQRRPEIYVGTLKESGFKKLVHKIRAAIKKVERMHGKKWYLNESSLRALFEITSDIPFMKSTIKEVWINSTSLHFFLSKMNVLNDEFKKKRFLTVDEAFEEKQLTCVLICLAFQKALDDGWELYHELREKGNQAIIETHTFLLKSDGGKKIFLDPTIENNNIVLDEKDLGKRKFISHEDSLMAHKKYHRVQPHPEWNPENLMEDLVLVN